MDNAGSLPGPTREKASADFRSFALEKLGRQPDTRTENLAWEAIKGLSAMGYASFRGKIWAEILNRRT